MWLISNSVMRHGVPVKIISNNSVNGGVSNRNNAWEFDGNVNMEE